MMARLDLFSLFMLGIFGTGHCIGMCGPLVFAIPGQTSKWSAHVHYHLGRIAAYALCGAAMGGIGAAAASLPGIIRLQVMISLLAAVFILFLGLMRLGWMAEPAFLLSSVLDKILGQGRFRRMAQNPHRLAAMLGLGFLLGFLPCGLTYAALARALVAGGPIQGGLYLTAFGMGTLPGLMIAGSGAFGLFRRYRRQSDILAGMLMVAMALRLAFKACISLF
jgi:sulfite exporter TauE/SafE